MNPDRLILFDVCERMGIRMLVLFGSHAPGGLPATSASDVDLAIAFRGSVTRPSMLAVHEALAPAFPDMTLDPVFLGDADPLFRWEIMDRGVLLYGDIDEFLEFRAFAYRDFVDSADLRELEHILFVKKMNRIGERLRVAS